MSVNVLLRKRFLRLLLIAAWIGLGIVIVVLRDQWGEWWAYFAAISFVISLVYIVAEVLTWARLLRQEEPSKPKKDDQNASGG